MSTQDFSNRAIKSYEFLEQVGAGGFGAVYRAFQPSVNREVAIKVILPQLASQPEFIRRFEVEAQLIARLEHPHIVPLYDYWRDPDGAFLVMRWLPNSLHSVLRDGPWSPGTTANLLDQVAGALTVAHREGVIHRDIKPDNILLDEDNNAYLADFGIAKDVNVGNITEEGLVVGSPAYITPEQIKGEPITSRTDIYTLGLVVYEALIGERPYANATTPAELIGRHLSTPVPPLHTRRSTLPAALNEVIQTATAKEPIHRYANVGRFAAAFRAALPDMQRSPAQPLAEPLTERELEVLCLIVEGLSNGEIAQRLVLSAATVKWYIGQIYSKLDVHSRHQAIKRAQQLGLVGQLDNVISAPPAIALAAPAAKPAVNAGRAESTLVGVADMANPYKGLRAFQEADAGDFFGRAALTEQLLTRLTEEDDGARFLAVVGPSGSGKSSVVRAGLIPALRRGALPNSARWFITDMLPGTHPLEELEAALLRVSVSPIPGLRDQLAEDRRGLVRAAKRILPGDQDVELVLVIDQFEELFTLVDDEAVRTHFIDNLLSAATDPRSRVRIVLTLRADFYDRPLNYPRLAELMRSHAELMLPLTTNELERAIAGPAERVGLNFEPGLVAAMIADVSAQPGALPMLQYALTELFERRADLTLTLNTYRDSGGLAGSLARRADELFDDLEGDGQAAARQIFLQLVTLGEGTEDTRRRVLQAELESGIGTSAAVSEVLALYGKYRLLTFDRDPLTHGPTVEIAHEALIREWARLREWLTESREDLRIQRRLMAATLEWLHAGRESSFLASGARLTQFEALAADSSLALNQGEQVYLAASLTERQRQEAAEQERQSRELSLARQAANSATQAATSQHRAANRLRYLVIALLVFLLAAAILSVFAFNKSAEATTQQQAAQNSAATATFAQGQALNNASTAVANSNIANGQRLAAAANVLLPGSESNAEVAALLAIRSLRTGYSTQADLALQQANDLLFTQKVWQGKGGWGQEVAYSPDGKSLLIVSPQGIDLCDIASDCQLSRWMVHSYGFEHGLFTPDGRTLIGAKPDGQIGFWDVNTGAFEKQFDTGISGRSIFEDILSGDFQLSADGKVFLFGEFNNGSGPNANTSQIGLRDVATEKELNHWAVPGHDPIFALSPDGKLIVISTYNSTAVWLPNGTSPLHVLTSQLHFNSLAISSDDRLVLAGTDSGAAYLFDAVTGQELRQLVGHQGGVIHALFSPDGKLALTVSTDKTARLWDTTTGLELRRLTGHRDYVLTTAFSPDGTQVATASADNDIRLWNIGLSQSPGTLTTVSNSQLNSLSISVDGTRLFTTNQANETGTLWHISPLQALQTIPNADVASQFSSNGLVATANFPLSGNTATVTLLDGSNGRTLNSFTIPMQQGNPGDLDIALSPDGQLVALIGYDPSAIHVYRAATGQEVRVINAGSSSWSQSARFSPDSNVLGVGFYDGSTRLWDVSNGKLVETLRNPNTTVSGSQIFSVSFSPDGTRVAVGNYGVVALYDRATGKQLQSFSHGSGASVRGEFSPDGEQVLISGLDGGLDMWDVTTGQKLRTFLGHSGGAYGVFSPDGKLIYSISADGDIRVTYTDYHDLIASVCQRIFRDFDATERAMYGITDQNPTCVNTPSYSHTSTTSTPTPIR